MARTPGEIFSWRLCLAVASSIGLQIIFSRAVALVFNLDFLHLGTWMAGNLQAFSFYNFIQLVLANAAQTYIFASTWIAPPRRRFSRFYMLLDLFSLQNIAFAVLYALTGYFTLGFYSVLLNSRYGSLKKLCINSEGQCLVEESLFLECGGIWLGLFFFLKMHIFGSPVTIFPHVHQEKIHQIRGAIVGNVLAGIRDSVKPTLYFTLFYIVWGHKPRNVVKDVYSLYLEDAPLDNVLTLLGSGIWLGLWLYSSLFFTTMYNMRTVLTAFLTEPMKFHINSVTTLSLPQALALRWQYTGLLAARDFLHVANADSPRRSEVFAVSMPGGHPRTWNAILQETLTTIDSFSEELESIYRSKPEPSSPMKPVATRVFHHQPTIRNMAAAPQLLIRDHNKNLNETALKTVRSTTDVLLQKLLQKPFIGYFFNELPDWKLRSLLGRAQPVMWTCEGLAAIASASLHEDKYGIVQNDLNVIIESFMKLKQNLDKLTKSGLVPKKHSADVFTVKMKTAVLSSVRRSIYKITHTFAKYINDISLKPELLNAVQPFLAFKEF